MKFKVTAIHAKKPQFFYVGTDEEKASVKSNIFTEEYDRVANLEIDAETVEEALNKAYKSNLPVVIELNSHDKYGGRVLGDVIVNGQRLSAMLIANGHARPYFGEKKSSWCN